MFRSFDHLHCFIRAARRLRTSDCGRPQLRESVLLLQPEEASNRKKTPPFPLLSSLLLSMHRDPKSHNKDLSIDLENGPFRLR